MDSEPQSTVFETPVQVRSYELDAFAHVNHAVFLSYMEYARFDALARAGFTLQEISRRGWGVYVVRVEVDYLKEARVGDDLVVRTWADEVGRTSVVLAQEIIRGEDLLVRARVTGVWVGADRKPLRLPDEIRTAFGLGG